jgi:hypothetical protein
MFQGDFGWCSIYACPSHFGIFSVSFPTHKVFVNPQDPFFGFSPDLTSRGFSFLKNGFNRFSCSVVVPGQYLALFIQYQNFQNHFAGFLNPDILERTFTGHFLDMNRSINGSSPVAECPKTGNAFNFEHSSID